MKWLRKATATARVMVLLECGLFLVLLVAGLLVTGLVYPFERPLAYGIGLLTGCASSIAKILLMDRTINRVVDMEGKAAQGYAGLQSLLRYFLTIGVVVPVFLWKDVFGLFGTIAGILSLQLTAYLTNPVLVKLEKSR